MNLTITTPDEPYDLEKDFPNLGDNIEPSESRVEVFARLLIDLIEISGQNNGQIFGGFVRDLIYGYKAKDVDIQFRSRANIDKFMEDLRKNWKVVILKNQNIQDYTDFDRKYNIVKTVVYDDNYKFNVDLVSKEDIPFYYDFSTNFYAITGLSNRFSLKGLISNPYFYLKYDYAFDVVNMIGFEDRNRDMFDIWGVNAPIKLPILPVETIKCFKPKKFYINSKVNLSNEFMKERYMKLIDRGFVPILN